jgi:hypothetical protein
VVTWGGDYEALQALGKHQALIRRAEGGGIEGGGWAMGRRRGKEARKGARACSAGEFGYMHE